MFKTAVAYPFGRPITARMIARLDFLILLFMLVLVFLLVALGTPAKAAQCNTYFLTDKAGQLQFPLCPPNRSTGGPGLLDNMTIGSQVPAVGNFTKTTVQQGTPATLNATGTLTAAQLATGIVTSTSAAAVAATLPLGTAMDTANPGFGINTSFDFYVVNTGPSVITMTASTGFTIVGLATVATITGPGSSGHFRAVRTAANTWVLYRVS